MSRIGKQPISVPSSVTIDIGAEMVTVTGPKGSLKQAGLAGTSVALADGVITVNRKSDEAIDRANHGLLRTLINNMVVGVTEGYTKQLEINGVGYRVSMAGNGLKLSLGFSHDINYPLPEGVTAKVEQNIITLTSIDKQRLGQVAAEIRSLKKPEPYKGKGIKYVGERIIRKSGKSGKEK